MVMVWGFLKQSCQRLQIGFSVSWLKENTNDKSETKSQLTKRRRSITLYKLVFTSFVHLLINI